MKFLHLSGTLCNFFGKLSRAIKCVDPSNKIDPNTFIFYLYLIFLEMKLSGEMLQCHVIRQMKKLRKLARGYQVYNVEEMGGGVGTKT